MEHKISGVQSAFLHVLSLSVWTEGFTWKVEQVNSILSQQLTKRSATPLIMRPHLVSRDTGSDAEVWTEPGPVLCCMRGPRLEVCLVLSEGSYCASASGDSQVCWARGHPGPLSHPERNPRAQDHLQRKRNQLLKGGRFPHHPVCGALWWWLTAPAKHSSLLLGFLCPDKLLSLNAGTPSWPGAMDTPIPEKNTFILPRVKNK